MFLQEQGKIPRGSQERDCAPCYRAGLLPAQPDLGSENSNLVGSSPPKRLPGAAASPRSTSAAFPLQHASCCAQSPRLENSRKKNNFRCQLATPRAAMKKKINMEKAWRSLQTKDMGSPQAIAPPPYLLLHTSPCGQPRVSPQPEKKVGVGHGPPPHPPNPEGGCLTPTTSQTPNHPAPARYWTSRFIRNEPSARRLRPNLRNQPQLGAANPCQAT